MAIIKKGYIFQSCFISFNDFPFSFFIIIKFGIMLIRKIHMKIQIYYIYIIFADLFLFREKKSEAAIEQKYA
jgi:hypothetical protein